MQFEFIIFYIYLYVSSIGNFTFHIHYTYNKIVMQSNNIIYFL